MNRQVPKRAKNGKKDLTTKDTKGTKDGERL